LLWLLSTTVEINRFLSVGIDYYRWLSVSVGQCMNIVWPVTEWPHGFYTHTHISGFLTLENKSLETQYHNLEKLKICI